MVRSPIGTGYKRGMEVQGSMRKALETIGVKNFLDLQDLMPDTL